MSGLFVSERADTFTLHLFTLYQAKSNLQRLQHLRYNKLLPNRWCHLGAAVYSEQEPNHCRLDKVQRDGSPFCSSERILLANLILKYYSKRLSIMLLEITSKEVQKERSTVCPWYPKCLVSWFQLYFSANKQIHTFWNRIRSSKSIWEKQHFYRFENFIYFLLS